MSSDDESGRANTSSADYFRIAKEVQQQNSFNSRFQSEIVGVDSKFFYKEVLSMCSKRTYGMQILIQLLTSD